MQKGFTFVGVVVATFVATTGILAIFSLATSALQASRTAEMRLIASGLAEEGIEVVRAVRQSYTDWSDWGWYSTSTPILFPVGHQEDYCLQYDTQNLGGVICPAFEAPLRLFKSGGEGIYQYLNGEPSLFYRKVTLTRLSEDEIKVVCEVKWKVPGENDWHRITIEDRLWRWK